MKKLILCMIIFVHAFLILSACGKETGEVCFDASTQTGQRSENDMSDTEDTESLYSNEKSVFSIYICGQVNLPGVYEMEAGSRINDAVEKAGGFTDQACRTYWNLAEELSDGQMIWVPTEEEAAEAAFPTEESKTEADDGRININTADAQALMSLSGIGQAKAESIISYREENGDFSSTSDITNVSGIGESIYIKIKDQIKVE